MQLDDNPVWRKARTVMERRTQSKGPPLVDSEDVSRTPRNQKGARGKGKRRSVLRTTELHTLPRDPFPHMQAQFVVAAFDHAKKNLGAENLKLEDEALQFDKGWVMLLSARDHTDKVFKFAIQLDNKLQVIHDDIEEHEYWAVKGRGHHKRKEK